jgi:hypothetical protein
LFHRKTCRHRQESLASIDFKIKGSVSIDSVGLERPNGLVVKLCMEISLGANEQE